MTCWGKWNATWHLCYAVLLMSFCGWNTDWAITWGMRCSVMFIHVKTSSTEEGMIVFTRAPLCHHCTSLRRVTAQAQEPELIAAARVNACIGFIPARFWTVPEAALQRVYTAICHATKTVKTPFIIWISFKKKKKKTVFVRYTCVPNRKTHTETVRYEYVYRFTPNIYDSLSLYEKATLFSTKKVFHRGKCGWATSNRWRGQTSPFWANYHFKYWLSVATNKSSDIKHGCSRGFCSLYSTRRRRLIYSGLGPHSSIELSFSQPNRISGED